ncbi:MAG: nitroreductase family protein, partial [Actinobacteria bacterium]|nr:nitroreductase family protein [Actinomycetota bacterium]
MSDIYDFIIRLRAIRDYKADPLTTEDLEAILEAARWTGSSKNRQDWSFVTITDPDRLQGLAEHG